MNYPISVKYIFSNFLMSYPMYENDIGFVEYDKDMCINVFNNKGDRFLYSLKDGNVLNVEPDIDYVSYILGFIDDNEINYRRAFSRLLKGRLVALNISAMELANISDISYSSIVKYLNIQRTPSAFARYSIEKNLQNSQNDIWRLP